MNTIYFTEYSKNCYYSAASILIAQKAKQKQPNKKKKKKNTNISNIVHLVH